MCWHFKARAQAQPARLWAGNQGAGQATLLGRADTHPSSPRVSSATTYLSADGVHCGLPSPREVRVGGDGVQLASFRVDEAVSTST